MVLLILAFPPDLGELRGSAPGCVYPDEPQSRTIIFGENEGKSALLIEFRPVLIF